MNNNLQKKQAMKLAELENSIGYLLRRVNRKAREVTIPILSEKGLSPLELTTLYLVNNNPDCTLGDLAKAVFLEPPATHRLLNSLEKKRLISRRKSAEDARFILTRITKSGQEKIADSIDEIQEIERLFLDKLDNNQKEIFITILKALAIE